MSAYLLSMLRNSSPLNVSFSSRASTILSMASRESLHDIISCGTRPIAMHASSLEAPSFDRSQTALPNKPPDYGSS